ncbi:MAG: polysaccharide pyruvyl transferase family protein [Chloroflexi bacterium]|nr:polysaccharide pyruvyl transferase family protein [Chloroflexota bacterium]
MTPSHRVDEQPRIVILGWYGSDNTGDEAVLQAVVEALRKRGYTNLCALSVNPTETTSRLDIDSVPRLLGMQTLRALLDADALILGGGGLIQDGTSLYNLPIYAGYVALARLLRIPVIGWGLGVEPVFTQLGKYLARFICSSAVCFSVRDNTSKRLLRRAGVPGDQIKVTADPAFLICPDRGATESKAPERPLVIFCIRSLSDNHPGINLHYLLPVSVRQKLNIGWRPPPERGARFVEGVARGIKVCVEEFGARVILLPLWPGRDDAILDEVKEAAIEMGVPTEAIRRSEIEQRPDRIAGYIGSADLLVSMRLHALIFGARQGVPLLALSYARKVRGLMKLLDRERWVVEVETRSAPPEEIEMKLRLLWQARKQESQLVRIAAIRTVARAEADADEIVRVLQSRGCEPYRLTID